VHCGVTAWSGGCWYDDSADTDAYQAVAADVSGASDIQVPCFTLDHFLEHLPRNLQTAPIDYMKVDIEGSERAIFKAGGKWAERTRCLKAELHDYPFTDAVADLAALGFYCAPDDDMPHAILARREI
jgi:hypothetical protein